MLKLKILTLLFSMKVALCSNCHTEKRHGGFETDFRAYKITKTGTLPKEIPESSGLATARPGQSFWTHNDGGSPPELFEIEATGKVLRKLPLPAIRNRDWEDLAQDDAGNLYIGDFGNNLNQRRDLTIYKLHPDTPERIDSITYRYEDQTQFPPPKDARNFDAEAFLWYAGNLYIFSKNRGSQRVNVYILPDQPGDYVAKMYGSFRLRGQVTAADINPARTRFAVMAYGKVVLFDLAEGQPLLNQPALCVKVARTQTEAIRFVNDTDFIITNEQQRIFLVERQPGRSPKRPKKDR
jgi:hypothetical protein